MQSVSLRAQTQRKRQPRDDTLPPEGSARRALGSEGASCSTVSSGAEHAGRSRQATRRLPSKPIQLTACEPLLVQKIERGRIVRSSKKAIKTIRDRRWKMQGFGTNGLNVASNGALQRASGPSRQQTNGGPAQKERGASVESQLGQARMAYFAAKASGNAHFALPHNTKTYASASSDAAAALSTQRSASRTSG